MSLIGWRQNDGNTIYNYRNVSEQEYTRASVCSHPTKVSISFTSQFITPIIPCVTACVGERVYPCVCARMYGRAQCQGAGL